MRGSRTTTSHVAVLMMAGLASSASSTRCSPRRDGLARLIADVGQAAEAQQKQVLAFDIGQHQGMRNAFEHVR